MTGHRRFAGKRIWITGASRGLGRALAINAANEGAEVIVGARDQEALRQLVTIIQSLGGSAHALPLDLMADSSIEEFSNAAFSLTGTPSILINNAGVGLFKDFLDLRSEDLRRQLRINFEAPWLLSQIVAKRMKLEGDGTIAFISSIAGTHAFRRGSAYAPSKAALNSLAEVLTMELRDDGIKVVTIAPGSIRSGFHQQALPSAHHNDQEWMMTPDEVAKACVETLLLPENVLPSFVELRPRRNSSRS